MRDKFLDFVEGHRKIVLISLVVIGIIVLVLFAKSCSKQKESIAEPTITPQPTSGLIPDVTTTQAPKSEYQSSLGIGVDKPDRVEIVEATNTPTPRVIPEQTEPTYSTEVRVFGNTSVPNKNMDGSSCKAYLDNVNLKDFGTYWGDKLSKKDFKGGDRYLVGVEQEEKHEVHGDLESVGWLIKNLGKLKDHDAVMFTNLHVVGSLDDNHVALLCMYDWYSAFGMKDTLVVFEDISNTLNVEDFCEGDIFSATVFVHNIKVLDDVKGQRVVVVQYNTFD